ncbi:MAG: glycosyltransferase family 9 protein [Deltaproteobacteria bacterium]|nr:MAG: glycosyltransferase family 9 protein [Deltaproteobacteria bacterium]
MQKVPGGILRAEPRERFLSKMAGQPRKVLVVAGGGASRLVECSVAIHALKKKYPAAETTLVASGVPREIAECVPDADKVVCTDGRDGAGTGLWGLLSWVWKSRFDVVLCQERDRRSELVALASGAPLRVGWRKGAGRLAFNEGASGPFPNGRDAPITALLDSIGVDTEGVRPRLKQPEGQGRFVGKFRARHGLGEKDKLVALCLSGSLEAARWPEVYFASLAEMLKERGFVPVLFGAKRDARSALEVGKAAGKPLVSCVGSSLEEMVSILSVCEVAVGGDSHLCHLAGAIGVPVVMIFGPTEPSRYPLGDKTIVMTASNSPCKPCWDLGRKRCPKLHHDCMRLVTPDEVLEKLRGVISLKTPVPQSKRPSRDKLPVTY